MKKEKELKKVLEIAIPSTIAWIGHIGYNVVDNIMTGKMLGTTALAVSGLSSSIYFMFLIFGMASTGIITALISERVAKRESEGTIFVFQNSLIFCFLIGAIISILLFFSGEHLVNLINKQKELGDDMKNFVKILSVCPVFVTIFFAFERLTEGMNRTKIAMYTVFVCNILNIILNYVFLGIFEMGVVGVARSTLLVNIFEVIIIILFVRFDSVTKTALRFKTKFNSLKQVIYTAKLGLPGGVLGFAEASCFSITAFIAGFISIHDIAAHQLLSWSVAFVLTPVFGFSIAMTARIAYNSALGKKKLAFDMGIISLVITAIYMFIFMLIFYIFKYQILGFMLKEEYDDVLTIYLVVSTLLMVIFIEVCDGLQVMASAVLRGYKDTKVPVIFGLISYFLICPPLSYYFGFVKNMGVFGVWMGLGFALLLQAVCLISRFIVKFRPGGI